MNTVAERWAAALRSARLYDQRRAGLPRHRRGAVRSARGQGLLHRPALARDRRPNAEAVGRVLGLEPAELRKLRFGAAFHDIGKLGHPGGDLNKPGSLTDEERGHLEQHTVMGERSSPRWSSSTGFCPLVRHGHERWDGRGTPTAWRRGASRLALGSSSPVTPGDAMTTDRPYRSATERGGRREGGAARRRTQFDPVVVEARLGCPRSCGRRLDSGGCAGRHRRLDRLDRRAGARRGRAHRRARGRRPRRAARTSSCWSSRRARFGVERIALADEDGRRPRRRGLDRRRGARAAPTAWSS